MKIKKILLLSSIVILTQAFTGRKGKIFIPPGTVQINDSLFADETEISNLSWKEFVEFNKASFGSSSSEYLSSLPDTLVWRQKLTLNEPYTLYYFRHPAYNNYPVVGISKEQASQFCRWRTERVHVLLEIKEGKRKAADMNKPFTGKLRFEYRLPTKQEWEALALIGTDPVLKAKWAEKHTQFFNCINSTGSNSQQHDNADVTAPVKSYLPTMLGMYNLFGNVSEMVAEKGISKGGSWKDEKDFFTVWKDQPFDAVNSWTGFRCVCVLKK